MLAVDCAISLLNAAHTSQKHRCRECDTTLCECHAEAHRRGKNTIKHHLVAVKQQGAEAVEYVCLLLHCDGDQMICGGNQMICKTCSVPFEPGQVRMHRYHDISTVAAVTSWLHWAHSAKVEEKRRVLDMLRAKEDQQQVLHEVGVLGRQLQELLAWDDVLAAAKLEWKHIIEATPRAQRLLLPAPLSLEGTAEYQRTIKKLDLSKPFVNELIEEQMNATPLLYEQFKNLHWAVGEIEMKNASKELDTTVESLESSGEWKKIIALKDALTASAEDERALGDSLIEESRREGQDMSTIVASFKLNDFLGANKLLMHESKRVLRKFEIERINVEPDICQLNLTVCCSTTCNLPTVLRCSKCKKVNYCSKACQVVSLASKSVCVR